jgi:hypothetical protein
MTAPNLPATVAEEYGTGIEDLEDEVGMVPRIGINHPGGTFKDSLSGEEFPEIIGVPLGVFKQRVFWPAELDGSSKKPMCKSNDAKTGYPNMDLEKDGGFPWSEAPGLDPNTQPKDEYDRPVIDCSSCPFAQWGKNAKTGKNTPPPCKERHTYPFIYNRETQGGGYEAPYMESGIISFQGSGIKPSKMYVAAFVRNKLPLYAAVVRISLDVNKRGTVDYSVPKFTKIADVPSGEWEVYARDLPEMRKFLTDPPRPSDDGSDPTRGSGQTAAQAAANAGVVANANVTVAAPAPTVQSPATSVVNGAAEQPATQAAANVQDAVVVEDDDLPF